MKEGKIVVVLKTMERLALFSGAVLFAASSMCSCNGMGLIQTEFSSKQQSELKKWRDVVRLNDTWAQINQTRERNSLVKSIQDELSAVLHIRNRSLEDSKNRDLYDIDVREQIAYDGRMCFAMFAEKCRKNLKILKELKANDLIEELRRNFLLSQ